LRDFRLYVILDAEVVGSEDIVEIAQKVIAGGVDILQLRAKHWQDQRIIETGTILRNLAKKNEVLFIVNDRVDLAHAIDADGVHLGQDDTPIEKARKTLGANKIIGISTHTISQVQEALIASPDYVAIGPIFPTATKPHVDALTTEVLLGLENGNETPLVAIGGIDLDNLALILKTGIKRIATCRAIIKAEDISKATQRFKQRLHSHDSTRNCPQQ
jgi:thiamine-phosphate pyrophosphorylase